MINTKRLARRLLVGGIAVATVGAGLIVGVAGPASADPVTALVGVGSDTTQDVVNGAADSIGLGLVGSWDAVDPASKVQHLAIAPKRTCSVNRPNGSGQGVTALRQSGGVSVATFPDESDLPEAGCIDFARSSGAPAATDQANNGRWVYIPFALDAVAVASQHYGDATAANYNALSYDPNNAPTGQGTLQKLYRDGQQVTVNGTIYDPTCNVSPCTNGATPIHLYIPQNGSGTRSYWLSKMGVTTVPAWLHDHAWNPASGLYDGALVEEHDGTVLQGDANGIAPFSISQWVGQRNGHGDRRHGAHLSSLVNIAVTPNVTVNPLSGNFPTVETGGLNSSFIIRREVYNVVEYSKVDTTAGNASFDAALYSVFGPGQSLCGRSSVILSFGFGLLSSAPLGHTCGAIVDPLRAYTTG